MAVARFLAGEIGFLDIPRVVAHALDTVPRPPLTLEGCTPPTKQHGRPQKGRHNLLTMEPGTLPVLVGGIH